MGTFVQAMGGTIVGLAVMCAGDAGATRYINPPSGIPSALFAGDGDAVSNTLAEACSTAGKQIISQQPNQVICEDHVGLLHSALQQVILGNSYSTKPRTFCLYRIVEGNGVATVQARRWTETTMAFGQVQREDYSSDDNFNSLENFLITAGGQLPEGSAFSGVMLGVDGKTNAANGHASFTVTAVDAGSSAEAAGVKFGDEITKIAGKTFATDDEMAERLFKLTAGKPFPVELMRGGQALTVNIMGVSRPLSGPVTFDAADVPAQVAGAAPVAAPLSAPDELEKWAALRDKGLITEADYEAKKKQLLGLP